MLSKRIFTAMTLAVVLQVAGPLAAAGQEDTLRSRASDWPDLSSALEGLAGLRGLSALEGLSAMRSMSALRGLRGLSGLQGLGGLQGLSELGSLSALGSVSAAGVELWGLDGLSAPAGEVQEPADSLYNLGRRELNRGNYRRAADLFRQIRRRYPRSAHVPDSYYWEAFALYREGSTGDLRSALALLDQQAGRYEEAETRSEAEVLATRIRGELARRGDAEAAQRVTERARAAAERAEARERAAEERQRERRGIAVQEEEDDIRVAALNALLQMDAESAVPILREVLERRDPGSVTLRRKAVFLLSQKRTSETAQILLDAVRNDPDEEVRAQAVFWLSQVPGEQAVAALDSVLLHSTDRTVQEKAIFALAQHRSERAARALRQYVERDDVPEDLQENAIFWLGQSRSGENQAFLRRLYQRLRGDELRERVIFALAQHRSEENRRWLMDLALNPDESMEMRKKALFWAGQSGRVPIADLVRLYDSMDDREMREQLVFVYSQRREREAVDKLMDIARADPDCELRKKAVFWLGQSKDSRVADFLLELINEGAPECRP
ncbi:MAG: tetratricopeptide repeat protein [Gemmatimonadales bacterium]|nr:tetratricopeptide repeat protein [Gemmatimonadales bacterium]NIN50093.1 tetratricopeptide repeat protein [Gemmatimonadales bacterium]NIP07557.1 tetratricopeptide repeat protein [Gemmatimonadales bacterium]NIR01713.1 tetratricopeptide repeat protein [Gemmatimonadales bacterium]NIS65616.1 tetratricopeptide repeat protein [Gemmatimonadales bacterium]